MQWPTNSMFFLLQNGGALDYTIKCSYLQIYNENVSDLLDPEQTNLTIREDVKRGHYVDGKRG
jgi:kinesin family protein 15